MNLAFDEQQEMMRKTLKSYLEKSYPLEKARAFMEEEKDSDRSLWGDLADLGIFAILIDEEYGGLGLSLIDQLVIQEEAGRYLTPAPIKANAVATSVINDAGNAAVHTEILEGISEGRTICTTAFLEASGKWDEPSNTNAEVNTNGYVLNGSKIGVPFASMSDYAVVSASVKGEVSLFVVPLNQNGVSYRRLKTMDGTQVWYEVNFDNVQLNSESRLADKERPLLELALELGTIFTCAETIGGIEKILTTTTEYAKERIQFGKPIGSFQAIKHKLADILVGVETAKALTYYAALEVLEDRESRDMSVASAKVYCADTYHSVAREGIQIHGGMGFTWESDMHLFLKRATVTQAEYGDPGRYRNVIRNELGMDRLKQTT